MAARDPIIKFSCREPFTMTHKEPRMSKKVWDLAKRELYEKQQGKCNAPCGKDGKKRRIPFDRMEGDHIIARKWGGPDIMKNLQLLCRSCNRRKRDRSMGYLIERLRRLVGDPRQMKLNFG